MDMDMDMDMKMEMDDIVNMNNYTIRKMCLFKPHYNNEYGLIKSYSNLESIIDSSNDTYLILFRMLRDGLRNEMIGFYRCMSANSIFVATVNYRDGDMAIGVGDKQKWL